MPVESRGVLHDDHTIALHCPFTKYDRDDDGRFIGVTVDAFRVDPDGISVVWLEYFEPPPPLIEQAAAALKAERKPAAKGVMALATVGRIRQLAAKSGIDCELTHTPTDDNPCHASICGWTDDPGQLAALVLAFDDHVTNTEIPGFLD